MTHEKGKWYELGERDNPSLKRRNINGKYFSRVGIYTDKQIADLHAKKIRNDGNQSRVIPLMLWGKIFGYPDSIPYKKQCYVVFKRFKK